MMVLKNEEKLFESCLIKPLNHHLSVKNTQPLDEKEDKDEKYEKDEKDEKEDDLKDNQLILFTGDKKPKKIDNSKIELESIGENSIIDMDTKENKQ
jgi:hypothetical protein